MARNPKPAAVIDIEKRTHVTKAELAARRKAEKTITTEKTIRERGEVKAEPVAHKELLRVRGLLTAIGKNDDLFGAVINRYAQLYAEVREFEGHREAAREAMDDLAERRGDMEPDAYFKAFAALTKSLVDFDKQVQTKRRMMFDIERENLMTVAAALRNITKAQDKKANPLAEVINRDRAR
jgi:hypothetical protein